MIDSTDRERLIVTKEELYKMLAHEVSASQEVQRGALWEILGLFSDFFVYYLLVYEYTVYYCKAT